MRLRLGDDLPPAARDALGAAGLRSDPDAPLLLSGPDAWRDAPPELAFAVVGLAPGSPEADAALAAGAIALWESLPADPAAALGPLAALAVRAHRHQVNVVSEHVGLADNLHLPREALVFDPDRRAQQPFRTVGKPVAFHVLRHPARHRAGPQRWCTCRPFKETRRTSAEPSWSRS